MKQKLLVADFHNLGDAVLMIPFLRGAVKIYEVTVLCRPASAEIFRLSGLPLRVVSLDPEWKRGISGLVRFLSGSSNGVGLPDFEESYDVGVGIWPDPRVWLLMKRLAVQRVVGYDFHPVNRYGWYRPPMPVWWLGGHLLSGLGRLLAGRRLLDEALVKTRGQSHLNMWGDLARACGFEQKPDLPWFTVDEETAVSARQRISDASAEQGADHAHAHGCWIFHPAARVANKQWPIEGFNQLYRDVFQPKGIPVLGICAPGEISLFRNVSSFPMVATDSVSEMAALLSQSSGVVCHDSVVAHLGAALGIPVVALFGTCYVTEFAPFRNEEWVAWDGNRQEKPNLSLQGLPVSEVAAMVEKAKIRLRGRK